MISFLSTISADPPTVKVQNLSIDWRVTYIHLDLFPHLASWISPQIAIKVSVIVNKIYYNEEFNCLLEEKTRELNEKDRKLEQKDATILEKEDTILEIRELLQQQQSIIQQMNQRTEVIADQNMARKDWIDF